ncbi:MAG: hypothetical protein H6753_06055 [Candidatus Omnitrophica bacterium]|nr:hypothetical protein [Candidatus Omnitrophota bacterium]
MVIFEKESKLTQEFLDNPNYSFVETYVYFKDTLSESTIFGIDQEFFEGLDNPIHFKGADWMGLVGLQRSGRIWIAAGHPAGFDGTPSKERNWKFAQLPQALKPNTWYRLHSVVDYNNRKFVNFTIEGPGIHETLDLSAYILDYPNYLPFDKRALTYLTWTMDGRSIGGQPKKDSAVYFDDLRYGFCKEISSDAPEPHYPEITLYKDDFENISKEFAKQPIEMSDWVNGRLSLAKYQRRKWYLERDVARVRIIQADFARSGIHVVESDATLKNWNYKKWLNHVTR